VSRTLDRDTLLVALADRYDHQSARTVFDEALTACGLPVAGPWTPAQVSHVAWWLQQQGDRAQPAASALLERVGGASGHDPGAFGDGEDGEADDPEWQAMTDGEAKALFQQVAEAAVATALRRPKKPGEPT
jgi:hypothetical protein